MGYRKILVPHAGTLAGDKALEHALKLSVDSTSSEFTLLHVVVPLASPSYFSISANRIDFIETVNKLQNSIIEDMKMKMESIKKKVYDKKGISIDTKVVLGIPEDEISKFAKDYEVVVMAKRRKLPGIKAILRLGSTSRKVLEKVSTPILLVDAEDNS